MKNILDDLFYGKIRPIEVDFCGNLEYEQAVELLVEEENLLISTLSENSKQLLEKFSDAQRSLNEVTALEYFKLGFKLAAKLHLAINDNSDILEKLP